MLTRVISSSVIFGSRVAVLPTINRIKSSLVVSNDKFPIQTPNGDFFDVTVVRFTPEASSEFSLLSFVLVSGLGGGFFLASFSKSNLPFFN